MEEKIAILGIIVRNNKAINNINDILHEYGSYIIGRLGVPYHQKEFNIITIVLNAKNEIIENIKNEINKLDGINSKVIEF